MHDLYDKLVAKLTKDKSYNAIADPFKRMHYFVKRHDKILKRYGDSVLQLCQEHEQNHRKSYELASRYVDRVWHVYDRFIEDPTQVRL